MRFSSSDAESGQPEWRGEAKTAESCADAATSVRGGERAARPMAAAAAAAAQEKAAQQTATAADAAYFNDPPPDAGP